MMVLLMDNRVFKISDKEEIHVINGDGNFVGKLNEGFRYIENIANNDFVLLLNDIYILMKI